MDFAICIGNHSIEQIRGRVFQFHKPLGQRARIIGPERKSAGAVLYQHRGAALIGNQRRKIHRHRLQHRQPERLYRARMDEQVGLGHFTGDIAAEAGKFHIGMVAQSACPETFNVRSHAKDSKRNV